MKPIIGVTCNHLPGDEWGFSGGIGTAGQSWTLLADDYVEALEKGGAIPVLIPFLSDEKKLIGLLERLDGVIISGGNDVNPLLFGERCEPETGRISQLRDGQDFTIVNYIINHTDKPLLGICRGLQVLTVSQGGSLNQHLLKDGYREHDLASKYQRHQYSHMVKIHGDTLLGKILEKEEIQVNSFHHQGVKTVPEHYIVQAVSDDGVIEAIAREDKAFCLAVQWHPEMMPDCPHSKKLFQALVDAASG